MTTPITPGEQPTPAPVAAPPVKPKRRWLVPVLAGIGVLILALCVIAILAPTPPPEETSDAPATQQASTTTAAVEESPTPTSAPAPPPPAPTTKPAPAPPPTVDDGVWTVGVDIPAGRYRTTEAVEDGCYWAILKTGTNGNTIIANDLPSGGRPQVTLKAGQDFETDQCGTWAKV